MPVNHIDPDRKRPDRKQCYLGGASKPNDTCVTEHPEWRHATSYDEVQEWLNNDLDVRDQDGDQVERCDPVHHNVILTGGGEYGYNAVQILLENVELVPPTTPEEEDDALASIMDAFKNRRLS